MKQVNIILRLEKHGNDVPKSLVTPAEVAILVAEHHLNAGGNPVVSFTEAPDVARDDNEEIDRLKRQYNRLKVEALFPGGKPSLPTSMKDAVEMGMRTTLPGSKLIVKK